MTILTSAELEILMDLRMSWGRLYSNEITRLQNEGERLSQYEAVRNAF